MSAELLERLLAFITDPQLARAALIHPSYRAEHPAEAQDNQRLEFLGDAVLDLLAAEVFFKEAAHEREGMLTVLRSQCTSDAALAQLALEIGLERRVMTGNSVPVVQGHALADALEAIFGAIFVSAGFSAAREAFMQLFSARIERLKNERNILTDNPKGTLQTFAQTRRQTEARYELLSTSGPAHKCVFFVKVSVGEDSATGEGTSRKAAERSAAENWLARFAAPPDAADFSRSRRLHAVGVCGVGMAGVAEHYQALGWKVGGCDISLSAPTARRLADCGVELAEGHSPEHLGGGCELVVKSAAIPESHPEILRAKNEGIEVISRGEALARLANARRTIAVAGTHGKTTTACFIVEALRALGDPVNWCVGGWTEALGGPAGCDAPPEKSIFVIEADESDGTLALYKPEVAVITNIEPDHLENFGSFEKLKECFATFSAHAKKIVRGEELKLADCRVSAAGTEFEVFGESIKLPIPGRHNAVNAACAFGALLALGFEPRKIAKALASLRELPRRRFERTRAPNGATIISDYAHHPTEIAALVSTARLLKSRRLLAVFQPHRFSRTRAFINDFSAAFAEVDELVLLPVYAASETDSRGGTHFDLYRAMRETFRGKIILAESLDQAAEYFRRTLGAGDALLVVGAGSVVQIAQKLTAADFSRGAEKKRTPLAGLTTLKVGGDAEIFEPESIEELSKFVKAHPECLVLGGGSNLLISDCGVSVPVVRLRKLPAGAPGATLVRRGLVPFMAGIPGTIGGWCAMNAGAHGHEFGEAVESIIAAARKTGEIITLDKKSAGFSYRKCSAARDVIIAEVKVRALENLGGAQDYLSRRADFSGLNTAGSIFKNPPNGLAGKLLEEAGCKTLRVGGAFVSERHANVIATDSSATASDVAALIELLRSRVEEKFGITLETEIKRW